MKRNLQQDKETPILSPIQSASKDFDGEQGGNDLVPIPLQGGAVTVREKANLEIGRLSMVQNMRGQHPGFKSRKGMAKLHDTADSTNKVVDAFQFNKTKASDDHFLALMSDGDILDATNDPPTVATSAVFGSELWSGTAAPKPPSWSVIDDKLLFSNSVDQHQVYAGSGSYIDRFIVYKGSAAPPNVPTLGEDYSLEVTDGLSTSVAVLDALDTYANFECVFINTSIPINSITWTVSKPNGNASVSTLYYRKNDNTWADTSMTDTTIDTGKTLAQTGSMTWTIPTDEQSAYMYGVSGFWYQLRVSAALDAEVEVSSVTYAAPFQDLRNVWDGVPVDAVEVQVEGDTVDFITQYSRYSAGAVSLSGLASGKQIVIASADKIEGIYIDPGATPNTTAAGIAALQYWNGSSFAAVGTIVDGTSGLSSPGWITFPRNLAYKRQFGTSSFFAYWYELTIDGSLSDDMVVYIQTMPYFDIGDFGKVGNASAVWQNRAVYTFDRNPEYMYISTPGRPMVLNGFGSRIEETGDGRPNKIVAMRNFYNELKVWQEESGVEGGTTTLFYGDSQTTDKIKISSRLGTLSAKSVDVVDGIRATAESTNQPVTLSFFLSRLGVCVCDGRVAAIISDDIQNYFDPEKDECIRRGYEEEMWLKYDSTDIVIRMGLVSGGSATLPNVFPVYDLMEGSWSFDSLAHELSSMTEVEAASGDVNRIQVGGGTNDGTIYRLNTTDDDVSTAIDKYIQVELDAGGLDLSLIEYILRAKTQAAGDITVTPYINDQAQSADTLSMVAGTVGDASIRHRKYTNQVGDHISIKIQNSTAAQELYLENLRLRLSTYNER